MKYIDAFKFFFERELPRLQVKKNYWPIPVIPGFSRSLESSYEANVELKHYLHDKWHSVPETDKFEWAKVIVADWGGVRANKEGTIRGYVKEISKRAPNAPIKGIASYSKIYSIVNLKKYAIYDARVAVSLNAVQLLYGAGDGLAFNYIAGRNNTTGHSRKKIGFAYQEPFKVQTLVQNGWERVCPQETYERYLQLLQDCLSCFPEHNLYDLEMALFSNAEHLSVKAMSRLM